MTFSSVVTKDKKDDWNNHWENFNESSERNPAQQYRRKLIIDLLKKNVRAGQTIIDIGSGAGVLAKELVRVFPSAIICGVELSAKGISLAQSAVPAASFFQMDVLSNENIPPVLQQAGDFAICSEVLEHLDDPLLFLKNTAKMLKHNSHLIVTVPGGYRSAYDEYIGHRKHFKTKELRILLEKAGFKVNSILTAGFPFFNLYKMITILRGKKLIQDVHQNKLSQFAKCVMSLFSLLFKMNLRHCVFGWQLVAYATLTRAPTL